MANDPDPWWVTWGAKAISAAMVAFLIWFLLVLFFDRGGPCLSLGGC
ncbi:MAG TPA: hypothetical protein VMZ71_02035 [Gemmataceae bacterium]|nr:hypothetical protein [Gemmataceae bacterium]